MINAITMQDVEEYSYFSVRLASLISTGPWPKDCVLSQANTAYKPMVDCRRLLQTVITLVFLEMSGR